MEWGNFKQGISILDKYIDDDYLSWAHASHDKVHIGPNTGYPKKLTDVVSDDDIDKLKSLGFYHDEELDAFMFFT